MASLLSKAVLPQKEKPKEESAKPAKPKTKKCGKLLLENIFNFSNALSLTLSLSLVAVAVYSPNNKTNTFRGTHMASDLAC